jgi:excisionase family DNA binding protein
LRMV